MPKRYSTLAIAAIIFSLLFFIPFFPLIGVIAGVGALVSISKDKKLKGKGLAIAAIIIGSLITISYVFLFVAAYGFFISIFGGILNVAQKDPLLGIESCKSEKPGFAKDMCIIMTLSININNTQGIDQNLCDEHVITLELRDYCNAILKRDKSYCYNISTAKNRVNCLGMVEEIKRGDIQREEGN